jgi:hypothetical protein
VITPSLNEATGVEQKRDETTMGKMCNQAWPLLLARVVETEGVTELGCESDLVRSDQTRA